MVKREGSSGVLLRRDDIVEAASSVVWGILVAGVLAEADVGRVFGRRVLLLP